MPAEQLTVSDDNRAIICKLFADRRYGAKDLAEMYGLSYDFVREIVKGISKKNKTVKAAVVNGVAFGIQINGITYKRGARGLIFRLQDGEWIKSTMNKHEFARHEGVI